MQALLDRATGKKKLLLVSSTVKVFARPNHIYRDEGETAREAVREKFGRKKRDGLNRVQILIGLKTEKCIWRDWERELR